MRWYSARVAVALDSLSVRTALLNRFEALMYVLSNSVCLEHFSTTALPNDRAEWFNPFRYLSIRVLPLEGYGVQIHLNQWRGGQVRVTRARGREQLHVNETNYCYNENTENRPAREVVSVPSSAADWHFAQYRTVSLPPQP